MRLIHTADWQIGRVFRFLDQATAGMLQAARLDAISTIGRLAVDHGAEAVLVAGDVYDHDGLSDRTLGQALERMRPFDRIEWHLMPGNHDPYVVGGVWERLMRLGLPPHVRVHQEAGAVAIGDGTAWLLPAPLRRKRALDDPTTWMDQAETPAGKIRIGLAHGSITTFGSTDKGVPNVIAPTRPQEALLDYLALGDWHGRRQIGPRCWYPGTPEPDRFDQPDAGSVLLVEISEPGALPEVRSLASARYVWRREHALLQGLDDVETLERRLRTLHPDPSCLLIDLVVEGALALKEREAFERGIAGSLGAAFCHLQIDDGSLLTSPSPADLDAIAKGGVLRAAALRLQAQAQDANDPEADLAARALIRLYLEYQKLPP